MQLNLSKKNLKKKKLSLVEDLGCRSSQCTEFHDLFSNLRSRFSGDLSRFVLVLLLCFITPGFSSFIPKELDEKEFFYVPSTKSGEENILTEIRNKAENPQQTFENIRESIEENKDVFYQFYFKYPLDTVSAQDFVKVMKIKSQEAHRFVPVIAFSQYIKPKHLGFLREIQITAGPTVQEHVLLDPTSDSIIFIEECIFLPKGVALGSFVAINSVVEEKGRFYFFGMYLYGEEPSKKQIEDRKWMFKRTWENMMSFTRNFPANPVFKEKE